MNRELIVREPMEVTTSSDIRDQHNQSVCSYKSIHQLITCPVCDKTYCDPRILPCGHTFCVECLINISKRPLTGSSISSLCGNGGDDPSKDTYHVKCPVCKMKCVAQNVEDFSKNLSVAQLIKINRIELTSNNLCQICRLEPSLTICSHCNYLGCPGCIEKHRQELLERVLEKCRCLKTQSEGVIQTIDKQLSEFDYAALIAKQQVIERAEDNVNLVKQRAEEISSNLELYLNHCKDESEAVVRDIRKKTESISETINRVLNEIESSGVKKSAVSVEELLEIAKNLENPSNELPFLTTEVSTQKTVSLESTLLNNLLLATQGDLLLPSSAVKGESPGDEFVCPISIDIDKHGKLYVVDQGNNRISIVIPKTDHDICLTSRKPEQSLKQLTGFHSPNDVCINDRLSAILITDLHRLVVVMQEKTVLYFIGRSDVSGSNTEQFDTPVGVCVGPDDNIYVCDLKNDRIVVLKWIALNPKSAKTNPMAWFKEINLPFGTNPQFICSVQQMLVFTMHGSGADRSFARGIDHNGLPLLVFTYDSPLVPIKTPMAIRFANNKFYIVDSDKQSVSVFTRSGQFVQDITYSHMIQPTGIAISGDILFVTDARSDCIHQLYAPMH
ncbi:hypothetical protein ACOME3_002900 [Neoechinorhynchus agilis]